MSEEIKEILDYLKDEEEYYKKAEEVIVGYGDLIVEKEDIDKLLDYITNLQEENERLKELDENYPIEEQLEEALKYENIYKSRIDKAIEYITTEQLYTNYQWGKSQYAKILKDLLNILQGEDKE